MNKLIVALFTLVTVVAIVQSQPISREETLNADQVNTVLNNIEDVSEREEPNGQEQTLIADQANSDNADQQQVNGDLNQFGDVPKGDGSKTRTRGKRCLAWLWRLLGFQAQCHRTVYYSNNYYVGNGHHNTNYVYT